MSKDGLALVIMAAGMGSRFGGLKQITPVGPNGESILHYSARDAIEAGFTKIIFIINKEIDTLFRQQIGNTISAFANVTYVYQELSAKLPAMDENLMSKRKKPWGTAHAILCAEEAIGSAPFAVINADDYYGKTSYKILANNMRISDQMCMCGFFLKNTLTEHGTVSRGICQTENGFLKSIHEYTALDQNSPFPPSTIVSMNMWGLNSRIFPFLRTGFASFLESLQDAEKDEFFLPSVIDYMIQTENEKVAVLPTADKWYGITYKDDLPKIQAFFHNLS